MTRRAPATPRKTYRGEEAERITWRDEQAARLLSAQLLAGQVDPMSLVVEPPKSVRALLRDLGED